MKKTIPWNWIATTLALTIFGIITFGASLRAYRGHNNYLTKLQDTIKGKKEYILILQDTIEKRNKDIIILQQMLKKQEPGKQNSSFDKNELNSLNKRIREKDAEIIRLKNQAQQLKEKLEFLNSL